VRIGNLAARQFQLDSFGACLQAADLISTHFPFPSHDPIWSKLEEITLLISQLWRRPDQGLWDLRLRPEHYLSSKLSCWKGLHSATSLFQRHGRQVSARWKKEMNSLRSLILQEGFNPARQRYTLAFGENELDSSVLLIGLWGLHDWSDPEMVSTLILIESELRQGFWIRRGKGGPNHGDTDGGHTLSTLWWISALTATGRIDEASEALTELCRQSMPLGYLPEGFSVDTGRPLGNFPSARAQAVWIDTIARVERALRARETGAAPFIKRIAS
jgi:GH15 family glucan-1,4-alpha-glucosidase